MTLTAQQLHDLMSPLWERESKLRPNLCQSHLSYVNLEWWWAHPTGFSDHVWPTIATQLCESQMVRWLAKKGDAEPLQIRCSSGGWDVKPINHEKIATGSPLVVALAAACTAVLDVLTGKEGD